MVPLRFEAFPLEAVFGNVVPLLLRHRWGIAGRIGLRVLSARHEAAPELARAVLAKPMRWGVFP